MFEAEFWVAVAFVLFIAVLGYFQVHKLIVKGIDDRRDRIKAELDEARVLKEEALALLAQYEEKKQAAEQEAAAIVAGAKAEMEDFIARHTKMAENKIAQAEAQAVADVRSAAAEAAVAAAETILTRTVKGKVADDLIAKGIDDVKRKLN